jgi:hypothetical protein
MKKRQWIVQRHVIKTVEAQQRWDHAYQYLVQWSAASLRVLTPVYNWVCHHFNEVANRDLVKRSAHTLHPNGYLVIEEFHRFQSPKEVGELGALSNLYFATTSEAGTWSMKEIAQ